MQIESKNKDNTLNLLGNENEIIIELDINFTGFGLAIQISIEI